MAGEKEKGTNIGDGENVCYFDCFNWKNFMVHLYYYYTQFCFILKKSDFNYRSFGIEEVAFMCHICGGWG